MTRFAVLSVLTAAAVTAAALVWAQEDGSGDVSPKAGRQAQARGHGLHRADGPDDPKPQAAAPRAAAVSARRKQAHAAPAPQAKDAEPQTAVSTAPAPGAEPKFKYRPMDSAQTKDWIQKQRELMRKQGKARKKSEDEDDDEEESEEK